MYAMLFMTILTETNGTKCLSGESFIWGEYLVSGESFIWNEYLVKPETMSVPQQ